MHTGRIFLPPIVIGVSVRIWRDLREIYKLQSLQKLYIPLVVVVVVDEDKCTHHGEVVVWQNFRAELREVRMIEDVTSLELFTRFVARQWSIHLQLSCICGLHIWKSVSWMIIYCEYQWLRRSHICVAWKVGEKNKTKQKVKVEWLLLMQSAEVMRCCEVISWPWQVEWSGATTRTTYDHGDSSRSSTSLLFCSGASRRRRRKSIWLLSVQSEMCNQTTTQWKIYTHKYSSQNNIWVAIFPEKKKILPTYWVVDILNRPLLHCIQSNCLERRLKIGQQMRIALDPMPPIEHRAEEVLSEEEEEEWSH